MSDSNILVWCMFMGLTVEVKVGRKRTIVIPKAIAESLGIVEGGKVVLKVEKDKLIIEPIPDAIWLALRGEKIAEISWKEIEEISIAEQEKYVGVVRQKASVKEERHVEA